MVERKSTTALAGWTAAAILLTGFALPKLTCLACGLCARQFQRACDVVYTFWFRDELLVNLWEVGPFALLAIVAFSLLQNNRRPRWSLPLIIGSGAGMVVVDGACYSYLFWQIFAHGAHGVIMLALVPLPAVVIVAGFVTGLISQLLAALWQDSTADAAGD